MSLVNLFSAEIHFLHDSKWIIKERFFSLKRSLGQKYILNMRATLGSSDFMHSLCYFQEEISKIQNLITIRRILEVIGK